MKPFKIFTLIMLTLKSVLNMKNIKNIIQKNSLNRLPDMQYIFAVSSLYKYDMIYVYHHLAEGSKVTLRRNDFYIDGTCQYSVYYKDFKLGYVYLSSFFLAQYGSLEKFEAEIASMTKEKYLPIKKLDITVSSARMRLVS